MIGRPQAAVRRQVLLERRLALTHASHAEEPPEALPGLGRLSEAERVELDRIDAALARLTESDYGRCETCGTTISEVRLSVLPETTMCRDCAHLSNPRTCSPL